LFWESKSLDDIYFIPNPNYFELSNKNKAATKCSGDCNYRTITGSRIIPKGSTFGVKITKGDNSAFMIGVSPKNVEQNHLIKGGGWYLYASNGKLYSKTVGYYAKDYYNSQIPEGSIIEIELTKEGKLIYYLNGKNIGIAFQNIKEEVIPAIELWDKDDCVEFIS